MMNRKKVVGQALSLALALGTIGGCGKTKGDPNASAEAGYCEAHCKQLSACDDTAICQTQCELQIPGGSGSLRTEFETPLWRCLNEQSCAAFSSGKAFRDCTDQATVESSDGGAGGSDGGSAQACAPDSPVTCVDAASVRFCNDQGFVEVVACAEGMLQEGIISRGCESNAEGAGCTVDGFTDLGCEQGTPAFGVCAAATEQDLLATYVACFQDLTGAQAVISCYGDYIDESALVVDCAAATVDCARP